MFNVKHKTFNAPKPKIKSKNQNNSSPKCDDSSWFNSAGHSCLSVAITTATDRLATRLSRSLPWKGDDSRHDNPLSALRCGEGAAHLRICFLFTIFTVIYFCRTIFTQESEREKSAEEFLMLRWSQWRVTVAIDALTAKTGNSLNLMHFGSAAFLLFFFLFIRVAVFSSLYFKGKILSSSSFKGEF